MNQENQSKSIVAFNPEASEVSLIAKDLKSGGCSYTPMGRKAFALTSLAIVDGKPLVGRALKVAHWNYLQKCAVSLAKAQAASLAAGEIVPVRASVSKDGQTATVRYETAAKFSRHEVETKAPKMTEDDALELLAKSKGISVDDLKAALTLATAK
jgi:hypothetical protein